MGNDASKESTSSSVMKKSPSQSAPHQHTTVNHSVNGVPQLNSEAPPNYDELFGAASPAPSSHSSISGGSSSSAATSPRSAAPPVPEVASYQIPPPSAAAWGTASASASANVHPQYSVPAPNWRQQEEEAELRMWFSAVDENNDGFITSEELRQALLNDNWTPFNMDTIKMMLKMFDRNMNDRIEFDEFSGLKRYVQEWKKVFDQYDVDHSGTIDVTEIQAALRWINFTFSLDFCTQLCNRFSAAGHINLDAFIYACAMINAMSKDYAKVHNAGSLEDFVRAWLNRSS
ncbi:putative Peflin [Hypsibius exemplaris]|uniref:Peflin n=1 Tax=Hypsibius exemplaris TaxID=2072580 RepID=A0A1W0XBH5_HYPEX|nr:putative Peflin [Hypsibius exemplaris]